MPLQIVRHDITKMKVDAIVNAANPRLAPGGGVCGAIHAAAGPELYMECIALGGCKTGMACITKGYQLPARYVIHTVGPVWHGGLFGEEKLLASCYRESLSLAQKHKLTSIAFPLISSGIYGYPKDKAFRVATDAIRDFLLQETCDPDLTVYLVVFDKESLGVSKKLYADLNQYIDDRYAAAHTDRRRRFDDDAAGFFALPTAAPSQNKQPSGRGAKATAPMSAALPPAPSLEDMLLDLDESFAEMLLRKIDEKGLSDPECYKRANLDRKLFSKIRSDPHYKPKKATAVAFAVALRLTLAETQELLHKAGYSLSHSQKFDLIVEYFIQHGIYDVLTINEALYHFDQPLLGGKS